MLRGHEVNPCKGDSSRRKGTPAVQQWLEAETGAARGSGKLPELLEAPPSGAA